MVECLVVEKHNLCYPICIPLPPLFCFCYFMPTKKRNTYKTVSYFKYFKMRIYWKKNPSNTFLYWPFHCTFSNKESLPLLHGWNIADAVYNPKKIINQLYATKKIMIFISLPLLSVLSPSPPPLSWKTHAKPCLFWSSYIIIKVVLRFLFTYYIYLYRT